MERSDTIYLIVGIIVIGAIIAFVIFSQSANPTGAFLLDTQEYAQTDSLSPAGGTPLFIDTNCSLIGSCPNIVYGGENISRLNNDAGYITGYIDTNCAVSHSCPNVLYTGDITTIHDSNYATDFIAFDFNMVHQYRKYAVDLNTSENVSADKNVNAGSYVNIGTNGYIFDDGNALIIGRRN